MGNIEVLSRTQKIIIHPTRAVSIVRAGPVGPPGPPGPAGATGVGYTHSQGVPSDEWTIVHNLGFRPNVSVVDSAGGEQAGVVSWPDVNTVVVSFKAAFGGTAYLS